VLQIQKGMATLPVELLAPVTTLLRQQIPPNVGCNALTAAVLDGILKAQLAAHPSAAAMDETRFLRAYEQYQSLEKRRHALSRQSLLHGWQKRQRSRLLAPSGEHISPMGAELKRRFVSRGENAMRLRQAVAAGARLETQDPLFDLRPVWMVSPEVAALVFPRKPIFDLLVFDEASQCRLEQSIPVLLRAERVMIAGDPMQLPPTRFFESASAHEEGGGVESEQELFEQQQSEVEDLLTAALNLAIEQTHLDVHYRSQNADLIQFSNQHFYGSRLEPLPSHPRRLGSTPPISFQAVGGVYDQRVNRKEAEAVVQLVRELLAQDAPPSIGIACFNLPQRDAIAEALESAAQKNKAFGELLETAQSRQGAAAFEGLFVKNLENVQGDERDHLIISTTFGPDPEGRFFRRFGPLAAEGGGRRLNVLITRARCQVHLITSIPEEVYRTLPVHSDDAKPNGATLLLAYVAYAEAITKKYAAATQSFEIPSDRATPNGTVLALGTELAKRLEAKSLTARAPWGTAGLGADCLVMDNTSPENILLTLLDIKGYARATNAVEWDLFRQSLLEQRGFGVHRVFSPRMLRDFEGELSAILAKVTRLRKGPAQ